MNLKKTLMALCGIEVALILFFGVWSASAQQPLPPTFYFESMVRIPSSGECMDAMEKGRILDRVKDDKNKTIERLTILYRKQIFYVDFSGDSVSCLSRGLNDMN